MQNLREENIRQELLKVKHPAINCSLVDLGIVKDISIKDEKSYIIMAFPFHKVPIKEQIIDSVRKNVENLNVEVEIQSTLMDQKELQTFLTLEKKNWKGP